MEREFLKELSQSGFIHRPLPLHTEKSFEAELEKKEVLKSKTIWKNGSLDNLKASGSATLSLAKNSGVDGKSALKMTSPFRSDKWPDGIESPATYINYSIAKIHLPLKNENWEEYNRFSCFIKPDFPDNDNVHCVIGITNDGVEKLPDKYYREGYHVVNLKNHEYNHVVWEFQDLPRDCITEITLYAFMKGYNGASGKESVYYFDDISVQAVETPDHAKGWRPNYDTIIYSTAGYDTEGKKTAFTTSDAKTFSLKDENDNEVLSGDIVISENDKGKFGIIDFSSVNKEGNYYIEAGNEKTGVFMISKDVLIDSIWKTINFLFCERCGHPVPGVHASCHHDMTAEHNGITLSFAGGWHDAGDMAQFAPQSAEITQALFETASKLPKNSQLYLRLIEEGEWGLDFSLRTRFGDGYRASHADAVRYTDNFIGTFDDVPDVIVHNHPLDNFINAYALASSGMVLKDLDQGRGNYAIEIAKEDYQFAMDIYKEKGYFPTPIPSEHTYPTGESLFYAIASTAASMLYKATNDEKYANDARYFADLVLECQETGEAGIPIKGFFYRDKLKKHPQHFNHQSREHYFIRPLILLCETQSNHPDKAKWENALKLYAQYLKDLMKYTAPYGFIPSGVYSLDETKDRDLFQFMHFSCDYDDELESFTAQIKNGAKLNDTFYVRCYPVWFSFRGNTAILLESGKAASMLGKYFNDEELIQIGREQIYWLFGKNPSVQSNMYGHGHRYCQQYAISSGEICGELPVGMESYGDEDIPYWPQGSNCTYKEIWTSSSRSFLWLMADLI